MSNFKKLLNSLKSIPARIVGFFRTHYFTLLLMLASGVLLTVIHPPLNLSLLAWIAWVPFMLACRPDMKVRPLMICAYMAGLCFWIGNLYWLVIVTTPGYIAFSFVQACYWPLMALSVRFIRQKNWPLFLAAPIIFVGTEAIQGWMFTGFSWYYLAHSQYQHLQLIQICDIFGTLGLSVLIAMVNGVVVDWMVFKNRAATVMERAKQQHCTSRFHSAPSITVGALTLGSTILIALLIAGTCWYGHVRLAETPACQTEGPLLGSVQPNVPAWVKEETNNAQTILDELIADSKKCMDAGAVLVAWPETMVLAPMNPFYINSYFQGSDESRSFRNQILAACRDQGYIVFGANGIARKQDQIEQYNSAYLYRHDGTPDPNIYHKIHLVPFGEFIPFRDTPWIYKFFMFFNPYDYDYSLTPGTEHTTFEIETDGKTYHFGVLICYEDTDPTVTRKHVLADNNTKKCDFLVNISNDGWYVRYKERQVIPMVELGQRTAISVFRCVENRISIIRSVNTGISCMIEPTGKLRNNYIAGTLPEPVMDRQGVAGWFVDSVPIDSRVTFFSKYGRWLDLVLGLFWSIILILSIYTACTKNLKHLSQP